MKYMTSTLVAMLMIVFAGCGTDNPVCSPTYCVTGEVFLRSELEEGQAFEELPANLSEETIANLLTDDVGEYAFESITVTGLIDWDFRSSAWQYREDRVTYLKKFTLEIESDAGRFGENRVLLVHLNKDTVIRDANFREHVDFLGTETVRLTHHIGIATFKGDIVGPPTK